MMRIAVYHNLPPGGAKRVLYEQIKGLRKNHEIHLYELSSTDEKFLSLVPFVQKRFLYRFAIKTSESRTVRDLKNFVGLPLLHARIAREIDCGGYDVVLVHPDRFTQAPFLLRFLKTPSIYFCEELLRIGYEKQLAFAEPVSFPKYVYEMATRTLRKYIDKTNAQAAKRIVVASKYIQRKVRQAYRKSAVVCGLGVDSKVFSPSKKKKSQILFVGDQNSISGYPFAKAVMDEVGKKHPVDFVCVSFQKGQPKLTDLEMSRKYTESLLTLCTSSQEPYGLVATESQTAGTPVLAVNEGGYRETIIQGKTGYLLKRDVKLFVQKINYLLTHQQKLKAMSIMAARQAKPRFNWRDHVEKMEELLEKTK